jgi:hypothetical protein
LSETPEFNFFDVERELKQRQLRHKAIGEEAKKVFEDTFATASGKRCLEILGAVLGARVGGLDGPTDPTTVVRQDTMRRVYWFIDGMARRAEIREIV